MTEYTREKFNADIDKLISNALQSGAKETEIYSILDTAKIALIILVNARTKAAGVI